MRSRAGFLAAQAPPALDAVVAFASLLFAGVTVLTGFWRWVPGLWLAMLVAGVAWIPMRVLRTRKGGSYIIT
jgi:hypothetical protein